jgi:hypothetical protein
MVRFVSRTIIIASALIFVLNTTPASASQIDFTGTGKGAWATFSLAGDPLGNPFSDFVGELLWNWIGTPASGFTGNSIYTYCVDATSYLQDPQSVTARSTDLLTSTTGGADAGGRVAYLVDRYAADVHQNGTNIDAAALQIAIWEALYDSTEDLSGGTFALVTTGAIYDKAKFYLDDLYSGGTYHTASATWLDTRAGQDQVLITPTPEPATLTLFGSALALAAARRRKRNAALIA